jgi:hypothetical protein
LAAATHFLILFQQSDVDWNYYSHEDEEEQQQAPTILRAASINLKYL